MWVFCEDGFLSIVAHKDEPGNMLVRGRVRADVEAFAERVSAARGVERPAVIEMPDADYRYRFTASRIDVARVMWDTVADINYPNFKDRILSKVGRVREEVYEAVWSIVRVALGRIDRVAKGKEGATQTNEAKPSKTELHVVPDPNREDLIGWQDELAKQQELALRNDFARSAITNESFGDSLLRELDRVRLHSSYPIAPRMPSPSVIESEFRRAIGTYSRVLDLLVTARDRSPEDARTIETMIVRVISKRHEAEDVMNRRKRWA